MRRRWQEIVEAPPPVVYLFGEDADAIFDAAERLIGGESDARALRVDIGELGRLEQELFAPALFGGRICGLVRNLQSAQPQHGKQLERMLDRLGGQQGEGGCRLVLCAPGVSWKKALHKRLLEREDVAACEFRLPDLDGFRAWLAEEAARANLRIEEDALAWLAERLFGLRQAARMLFERLALYDGGRGETLGHAVIGDLLGERAPDDLDAWCHLVAARRPQAVTMTRRMLADRVAQPVQMLAWLGTRLQQLLLVAWWRQKGGGDPLGKARVFGSARRQIGDELSAWRGAELVRALIRLVDAERRIKGASLEPEHIVMERLVRELVDSGRRS